MGTSPKLNEIRSRGNLPPDLHSSFLDWVKERYMPKQQQDMLNDFTDTGEYPEEFLQEWRKMK